MFPVSLPHENRRATSVLKNGAILPTSSWKTTAFGRMNNKTPNFSSD